MQWGCIFRLFYFTTHHSDIYLVCKVNEKPPFPVKIAIKKPALTSGQGNFAHALHCAFFSYLAATGNACPFSWQSLAFLWPSFNMTADVHRLWMNTASTNNILLNKQTILQKYNPHIIFHKKKKKNKLGKYENSPRLLGQICKSLHGLKNNTTQAHY